MPLKVRLMRPGKHYASHQSIYSRFPNQDSGTLSSLSLIIIIATPSIRIDKEEKKEKKRKENKEKKRKEKKRKEKKR